MHTKFYFAIFVTMKNTQKKEKKQIVKQEPKQVALSDADLLAFTEDSQQAEFYNEPLLNFITTL